MPDEAQFPTVSPYAEGFQRWLIEFTKFLEIDGPDVVDLTIIIMNCLVKMRGVLLAQELNDAVHNMVHFLEEQIDTAGVVLAEHWRHKEDGYELYRATMSAETPDTIDELFDQLPSDFDLRD